MPYKFCELPEYPAVCDVWDALKKESRPILVYGMGNGADKLFSKFSELGIEAADVFASDGFVRGHSYRGKRVLSFSEAKEKYGDFVIVLSFASNKSDVIDMLAEIDKKYDMYAPDMPISDVSEYFDKDFYNRHYTVIKKIYDGLWDYESKCIYSSVINYRLSGKISFLLENYTSEEELYSLIREEKEIKTMIDAGAYRGDTATLAMKYFSGIERIKAIEPDPKSFKKLKALADESEGIIEPVMAACYAECKKGSFESSGNRNSTISATASYEAESVEVDLVTVDSLSDRRIDFIKYDVEGAEEEALIGSRETIKRDNPTLLVSLYHKSRDIFSLAELVLRDFAPKKLYLRRLRCLPAWELDLIVSFRT